MAQNTLYFHLNSVVGELRRQVNRSSSKKTLNEEELLTRLMLELVLEQTGYEKDEDSNNSTDSHR
jgi:hypothetical protein